MLLGYYILTHTEKGDGSSLLIMKIYQEEISQEIIEK